MSNEGQGQRKAMLSEIYISLDPNDRDAEQTWRKNAAELWQNSTTDVRTTYDRYISSNTPNADGVTFEEVSDTDIRGWWCKPPAAPQDRAIVYLHGGAYVLGTAEAYRGFGSQIATRTGSSVLVLDYPLAPQARLPVAYNFVAAGFEWLARQGFRTLAVIGDSAGGGLALASVAGAVQRKTSVAIAFPQTAPPAKIAAFPELAPFPEIVACVAFSPWVDLTLSGATMDSPDPVVTHASLQNGASQYLGGAPADDPRASPLFGIATGMPPLYIQVGTDERLLDDSRRYANAAAATGAEVTLEVWEGMHHVFQRCTKDLASSREALDRASRFLIGKFAK
jgi:acetyl esterase/lipase